jgi:hypothetical protein
MSKGTLALIIPVGRPEPPVPGAPVTPEHPIYFPITPGHPIVLPPPEEVPPGYWGGVAPPHPDQGLPGPQPPSGAPPQPTHPIAPGGPPPTPSHPITIPPDPPPGSIWPGPHPEHPWVPPSETVPPPIGAPPRPDHTLPTPGGPKPPGLPESTALVLVYLPGVGWKYVVAPVYPSTQPPPGVATPKK